MSGDIEIPSGNPFANDKLNRRGEVVKFVDFVSHYGNTGRTIALNGAWGCGKTTFVKMAMAYMQSNDYHPLYFNAWENDFLEEPLFALLAEMNNLFPTSDNNADLLGKAAQVLLLLGNNFIKQKTGVDVKELTDSLQSNLAKYANTIKAFSEFRNALSEYVANNTTNIEKPVVFFIDELDRCNPNYAIKVLERIKHLFEVPNIVFVLSINKDILNHAVRTYYGNSNMDANNYLRRFIDIDYDMPENKMDDYGKYVYEQYGFEKYENQYANRYRENQTYQDFKSFFTTLNAHSQLDLRTMNKLYIQLNSAFEIIGDRTNINFELILLLCYLKVVHRFMYDGIKTHTIPNNDFLNKLGTFYEQDLDAEFINYSSHHTLAYRSVEFLYIYLLSFMEQVDIEKMDVPTCQYFVKKNVPEIWKRIICRYDIDKHTLNNLLNFVDFKVKPFHSNR